MQVKGQSWLPLILGKHGMQSEEASKMSLESDAVFGSLSDLHLPWGFAFPPSANSRPLSTALSQPPPSENQNLGQRFA